MCWEGRRLGVESRDGPRRYALSHSSITGTRHVCMADGATRPPASFGVCRGLCFAHVHPGVKGYPCLAEPQQE